MLGEEQEQVTSDEKGDSLWQHCGQYLFKKGEQCASHGLSEGETTLAARIVWAGQGHFQRV